MARVLFLLALVSLVSLVIAFPLWYLAVHFRRAYSFAVGVVCGILAAGYAVYRIREEVKESGSFFREHLLKALARTAAAGVLLVLLYGLVWLFARGFYLLAFPGLILYLLILGVLKYGRKSRYAAE